MKLEQLESEILQLDPEERAKLAHKLLESLEDLSEEENEALWAEEAERRDLDPDRDPVAGRSADEVLQDARSRRE